jgi:hypothetical protein
VAIRLISEQEKHSCRIGDATIFYRRVPSPVQKRIEAQHTKRGQMDMRAIVEEVLHYAVLSWEGVEDAEGQPVAFKPELLKFLPEDAKSALIGHLYAANPAEDAEKN